MKKDVKEKLKEFTDRLLAENPELKNFDEKPLSKEEEEKMMQESMQGIYDDDEYADDKQIDGGIYTQEEIEEYGGEILPPEEQESYEGAKRE